MIMIVDNGRSSEDRDTFFLDGSGYLPGDVWPAIRLVDPDARIVGTTSRVFWLDGRTIDGVIVHVARCLVLWVDATDEELSENKRREAADRFVADVPLHVLADIVKAMREEERDAGDIKAMADALARKRRAERRR